MSEVIITGTDAIRQMLRVRNKRMNLASLARELGISSDMLDAFIDGKRSLPIPVLQDLTKKLWNGHAVYDPEVDRLRPARQEPAKPLGVLPSLTIPLPTYTAGPAQTAHRPVNVEITEPPPSGTDAIREALRVRRKTNLAALARDHGLSPAARDAFIDGRRSLPAETLRAIAKDLWPHLEFDPRDRPIAPRGAGAREAPRCPSRVFDHASRVSGRPRPTSRTAAGQGGAARCDTENQTGLARRLVVTGLLLRR